MATKIIALIAIAVYLVALFALLTFAFIKFFRRLSKAKTFTEAKEAVEDFIEDIKGIADNDKLENVRNFTVNLIINIIENGDNFNIREILGSVKEKCAEENVEYNEEKWAEYTTQLYESKKNKE